MHGMSRNATSLNVEPSVVTQMRVSRLDAQSDLTTADTPHSDRIAFVQMAGLKQDLKVSLEEGSTSQG